MSHSLEIVVAYIVPSATFNLGDFGNRRLRHVCRELFVASTDNCSIFTIPLHYVACHCSPNMGHMLVLAMTKRAQVGPFHPALLSQPALIYSSFLITLLNDPRLQYLNLIHWSVVCTSLDQAHPLHDPQSTLDPSKYCMLAIKKWNRRKGNEPLTPVGIRPAVCHAQDTSTSMFQRRVDFVIEFVPID